MYGNGNLRLSMCIGLMTLLGIDCRFAHGADTVEPFDVGATDFELYTGMDGLGLGRYQKTVYGDIVLGYGITPRLSGYFGTTLFANEYFASGGTAFALGGYGNVIDTHHFDVDLFLDFSGGGGDFAVTPSLELNLDADPEMRSVGTYLRLGVPVYGREKTGTATEDVLSPEPEFEVATQIECTLGAYATLGEAHQLLMEFDSVIRPDAIEDELDFEVGGLAVGYNVMITDNLELINQIFLDIPQKDEKFSIGVSTGILATLP